MGKCLKASISAEYSFPFLNLLLCTDCIQINHTLWKSRFWLFFQSISYRPKERKGYINAKINVRIFFPLERFVWCLMFKLFLCQIMSLDIYNYELKREREGNQNFLDCLFCPRRCARHCLCIFFSLVWCNNPLKPVYRRGTFDSHRLVICWRSQN